MSEYVPSLENFLEKAQSGNLIPVYKEILADMETPVSAFKKVDNGGCSFLLESVEGGEKWGRYSFLGFDPKIVVKSNEGVVEIINEKGELIESSKEDPLNVLRNILSQYNPVGMEGLPIFFGGAVGCISYDMVRSFENLPDLNEKDLDLCDTFFMLTDTLLIFDNIKHTIKVLSNAHIDGKDIKHCYEEAIEKIDLLIDRLHKGDQSTFPKVSENSEDYEALEAFSLDSNFNKTDFFEAVERAKEYIRAGDIIQVVLSQRFQSPLLNINPFDIYRALRVINPSPYMFYLRLEDVEVVGSSPEILVRVEENRIDLRPIAGTRSRGRDEEEDNSLEKELLQDPKELAEHIMLVDLGRNDVGRVAEIGSVTVSELMTVERYSHVMHIVSHVHGVMQKEYDFFDALKACFPAGTLSGAPKIRAMEIIEELEPNKRGIYGGSVGYFGYSGNMDMCITIRTMVIKNGTMYLQAGAGIVADSNPELEYQETVNKAMAMFKAVEMARNGLD
jgi:anthranilate synthase component 1